MIATRNLRCRTTNLRRLTPWLADRGPLESQSQLHRILYNRQMACRDHSNVIGGTDG
jgi:hypothetical protein